LYPIQASRSLTLLEIVDHWSREIKPARSRKELLDFLSQAWWRGEIDLAVGLRRVQLLRVLYKNYQNKIAFVVPGKAEPKSFKKLPDGGVEIFRFWRVPLPSAEPDSWDDVNCKDAFDAVAQAWSMDEFEIAAPPSPPSR
jgi:hypothetical protein